MIDVKEAQRLDNWIREAVEGGAKLLCGGKRDGAIAVGRVEPRPERLTAR